MVTPLLEARNLCKSYGQVEALRGANFTVYPGEIVALIGDNGAGKSSLVRTLVGAQSYDSGEILIDGEPVVFDSPLAARALGIEAVYQDLALAHDLDPVANLYLGREIRKRGLLGALGVVDRAAMRREAGPVFDRLSLKMLDARVPVRSLSGGQQQSVAVARAVAWSNKVLFLDEPTAALGVLQRERVFNLIRTVRENGTAVVLISHNMPEVLEISDRIEVMRLGARVARFTRAEATVDKLVAAMTGALAPEEQQ